MRKSDTQGNYINLNNSYVLGTDKQTLKTAFRKRQIFMIEAIRERINVLMKRPTLPYLITMQDGGRFSSNHFCKVWKKAATAAGIPDITS